MTTTKQSDPIVCGRPIHWSNGGEWSEPVLVVRDSWDTTRGVRLYWADRGNQEEADGCTQVRGEINGIVYRTIADAVADGRRMFPGVSVFRWLWDGSTRRLA